MTGTERDPQCRSQQIATLEDAGIAVVSSLPEATLLAAALIRPLSPATQQHTPSLMENVAVINIGLRSFALELQSASKTYCALPMVASRRMAIKTGSFIRTFAIRGSHVYISGASQCCGYRTNSSRSSTLAGCAAGFFTYQRTKPGQNTASRRAANALAGDDRTHERACVGACLFEGWAKDEAQALAILEQGK